MAQRMPNRIFNASFDRQVTELRRVAGDIGAHDPEGAAACLFAASVLSSTSDDQGLGRPDHGGRWDRDGSGNS